jgi:hypothetical protein
MGQESNRALYKLCGVLWLVAVVSVWVAVVIVIRFDIALNPSELDSEVLGKTLTRVAEFSWAHILELVFDEISDLAIIILAPLLYLGLHQLNRPVALVGSVCLLAGGIILAAHNMGNFAVTWVAKEYALGAGENAVTLLTSARTVLLTAKWGVAIGSAFFVLGVLMYSLLVRRVSRLVGWLGIAASVLAFVAIPLGWVSPELEALSMNLYVPLMIWEITFGIVLLKKKDWSSPLDS